MDSTNNVTLLKNYLFSILKLCANIRYTHPRLIDKLLMKESTTDQEKSVIKNILSTPYDLKNTRSWSYNQIIISGAWKQFENTLANISDIVAKRIANGIDDKKFFRIIKEANKNPNSQWGVNTIRRHKHHDRLLFKVAIAIALAIATIIVPSAFFNNTNLSLYNDGVSLLNKSVLFMKRLANRASIDRIIINAIFDGWMFFPKKRKY